AGMVGTALACSLGDTPLRVAVIETRAPQTEWAAHSTDLRVSAVTQASRRIFTAVGAWETMTAERVSPFREMHVWDAGGSGALHFDSADIGRDALGYIIENRVIVKALVERMRRCDNVTLLCPAVVTSLAYTPDRARVILADGGTLTAPLVVGADGADSQVRRLAGLTVQRHDYAQQAVVAAVRTELPHGEVARQRFLPGGPLAFLPLWDGRCSIVWSTAPDHAARLCAMDESEFNDAVTAAFDHALGAVTVDGPRASFTLRRQHAERYTRARTALIGDAAHTVHPLAGQGVNLGLLDAAALSEVLRDATRRARDPGAIQALRRYERWRKGDNLLMMMALDGFKRLYGSTMPPLKLARNLGMNLFNHSGALKHYVMCRAMGLAGDLPPLAR
ncbi:MAG: UbiH/UbiF/VisC/COQ6 family ubiquinone biosynthesis hydroxylase, partial [Ktedonobacterales bacterium]|nr:UbiH/UbiF/VisC/COQ6 family ubiquinone biosynthesis hydroxylase [Ktedonobacterales bacterium]